MKFPIGAMSAGDVLDRGLKLLFARLPVLYAVNLIVLAPLIAFQVAAPFVIDRNPTTVVVSQLFAAFLSVVLQTIGTAATLHIVLEEFRGRTATIGQALSFAMSRFGSLLVASLAAGFVVGVGFLLCIAPGVYFAVSYVFVGQVVLAEGRDGGRALGRSKELISGHRGRVFGVILLIYLALFVVGAALAAALQAVLPTDELIPGENGIESQTNPVNAALDTLISELVMILFTTYLAVCTTLMYLDLRIRKEGLDLEMAAEQADAEADGDRTRGRPS